jgi:hypothetical protein
MMQRCTKPSHHAFHRYGGRGIQVCDRWGSFESFLEDMGPRPSLDHSIDRIDNDGDYEPSNCRWATRKEQANNTASNVVIEFNGARKTLGQWAKELGISGTGLRARLKKWPIAKALTTPGFQQVRGSKQGSSKITEEQVRQIKRRRKSGEGLRSLAAEFGVSESTVSKIALGKSWRHVS